MAEDRPSRDVRTRGASPASVLDRARAFLDSVLRLLAPGTPLLGFAHTAESGHSSTGRGGSDTGRAVTDGGSDGAPSPSGPWLDDDPISFDEPTDDLSDPDGVAGFDASTDDPDAPAPTQSGDGGAPFADDPETSLHDLGPPAGHEPPAGGLETDDGFDADVSDPNSRPDDGSDVADGGERLDALAARIGALETDHTHLRGAVEELSTDVHDVGENVSSLAETVDHLVDAMSGMALAAAEDGERTAAGTASGSAATASESEFSWAQPTEATPEDPIAEPPRTGYPRPPADPVESAISGDDGPVSGVAEQSPESTNSEDDSDTETAEGPPDFGPFEPALVRERTDGDAGIEPGATPSDPTTTERDASDATVDRTPVPRVGISPSTTDSFSMAREAADTPAAGETVDRSLVDPRTDAVGARLREFGANFEDDPVEDLPTGNAADAFRSEAVLVPDDREVDEEWSDLDLEKPYLPALPAGYAADAVVLEWLDALVEAADAATAAEAIGYYASVEWITGDVHDDLLEYLEGLGEVPATGDVAEPPAALDLQDHLRSLRYVIELASGEVGDDGI